MMLNNNNNSKNKESQYDIKNEQFEHRKFNKKIIKFIRFQYSKLEKLDLTLEKDMELLSKYLCPVKFDETFDSNQNILPG